MKKIIGIVDYEMGNLFSVIQACKSVGLNVSVEKNPKKFNDYDALILPGVGSFKKAMENIHKLGMYDELINFSHSKPIMGICLGFQLLFQSSTEFGNTRGLGIIKGEIVHFDNGIVPKSPHMGWNNLSYIKEGNNPLKQTLNKELYFVHSYFAKVKESSVILSKTTYSGFEFVSSINFKKIFGVQFHPEKSGKVGLEIYQIWAQLNNLI